MIEITPGEIKCMAKTSIYSRGQGYHRRGQVLSLDIKGRSAEAVVDGSRSTPYTVTVMQNRSKIKTSCTCPYDMGGICKHVVAVLLELADGKKGPLLAKDKVLQMTYEESVHLLENICDPISIADMEGLLKLWGIKDKGILGHKKEMVNSIIKASHDPGKIERILANLPQDEYDFLEYLSSMDFMISHFDAEVAVGYWERDQIYRSLRSKCLLIMIRAPDIHYIVPPHMHGAVRSTIEKRDCASLDITNIKEVRADTSILGDLMIFLLYTEKNRVQLTRRHNIYKRAAKKMAARLSIKDQGYFAFVSKILVKLDLIGVSNFKIVVNRKKTAGLFEKKKTEIVKAVTRTAFDMSTDYYGWNAFKSVFTDQVKSVDTGEWCQSNRVLVELKKDVLRNPRSSLKYWSSGARRRRLSEVLESLHLAGAVELGLSGSGEIYAFRLTDVGATFFTGREDDDGGAGSAKTGPCLYVQPNFEVTVLLDGMPIFALFTLNDFAELKNINEHTAIFMISKDSVITALERGIRAAEIIESLEHNSKTRVPQNVLYDIKEWASGFDRVSIQDMTVLKADGESLLDDIIRLFGSQVIERIGPTTVAVEPSAVKEITGKLKKMNIYPGINSNRHKNRSDRR